MIIVGILDEKNANIYFRLFWIMMVEMNNLDEFWGVLLIRKDTGHVRLSYTPYFFSLFFS
jgi:hypothetical protein